jgi:hypothetical protein
LYARLSQGSHDTIAILRFPVADLDK